MHLFLFLDDWMLDGYQDIVRRFPRPVPAPVDPWEGPHFHVSVLRDPQAGTYRCWYHRFLAGPTPAAECTSLRDLAWGIFLAESDDGVHWTPYHHGGPVDPVLPGEPDWANDAAGYLDSYDLSRPSYGGTLRVGGGYTHDDPAYDGDGYVDEIRFATTWAEAAPVPEPATLCLLGLGGLALVRRRR